MALFINLLLSAAVISMAQTAYNQDVKEVILQKLGLTELPSIQKKELENLVVPNKIKSKYLSLLKLHQTRRRRSLPSFTEVIRILSGNPDTTSSDMTRQHFMFDVESRLKENLEVTVAELKLYQTAPSKLAVVEKPRAVNHARVSVYWVSQSNQTYIVDSKLVPVNEVGWRSFDVTHAVHYWSKSLTKSPLHLEVRMEAERPGRVAAEMAKQVQFASPNAHEKTGTPELALYTLNLEEYGSTGDCRRGGDDQMCCREEYYIDFQKLTWAAFWVVEPAGYQAFRCIGRCKQLEHHQGYGPRTCLAMERSPLPVMYLTKKGSHTLFHVTEFPNMIVEKCGCSMNEIFTD